MTADYYPLQVLLLTFSSWVKREQQRTIEYLVEELSARGLRMGQYRVHAPASPA